MYRFYEFELARELTRRIDTGLKTLCPNDFEDGKEDDNIDKN